MDWKMYLRTYSELREEIEYEEERLSSICPENTSNGSPGIGSAHGIPDKMATKVCIREDLKEKLDRMRRAEMEMRKTIEDTVDKVLSPNEKQVIRLRYIDRNPWKVVTQIIYHKRKNLNNSFDNYERMALRIHGCAIRKLNKLQNVERNDFNERSTNLAENDIND